MRLVICDVGGVLCGDTDAAVAIAASLGLTVEAFFGMAGEHAFEALLSGAITESEFWTRFSRGFGRSVPENLWGAFFDPSLDKGVALLLREVRRTARVVAGTNTFESHYDILRARGWYEVFDAVYASHKMGTAKPAPAFYRYILKGEDCEPSDALFVDDDREHVAAARAVGLAACVYTDVGGLRRSLEERGLLRPDGP
jgi:FMN phosphatase YigB (HAD superfamily)